VSGVLLIFDTKYFHLDEYLSGVFKYVIVLQMKVLIVWVMNFRLQKRVIFPVVTEKHCTMQQEKARSRS